MIEARYAISTPDGVMPVFEARPGEGGPFPLVVFLMDALGIREELRDMARRIAAAGYAVYLPDLFYRDGCPSFDPAPLAQGRLDPRMVALNLGLTMASTSSDCGALLAHARADASIRLPGAVIGFCMGGRHAISAAATHPDAFAAMASLHGGMLVNDTDASPHRLIARMRAEAYFGWADDDPAAPPAHLRAVESALRARQLPWQVELHAGALHGFTFPERFCHHPVAAERVWSRLFSLFERTLHGPAQPG
ncbi:MAG: dienelactone hydrolase family protein [Lautropia sp.]